MATSADLAELIESYDAEAYRVGPLPEGRYPARITAVGAAPTVDGEILLFVGVEVLGGLYDGSRVPVLGTYSDAIDDSRWEVLTDGMLACVGWPMTVDTVEELHGVLLDKVLDLEVSAYDVRYADQVTVGDVTLRRASEEIVDKWFRA
jgi:hypothetical protein